jgi:predicted transcriptional regulator
MQKTTLLTKPDGKDVRATFRLWPDLFWDLKQLALDKRTTTTHLINEAIEDILAKYEAKRKTKK